MLEVMAVSTKVKPVVILNKMLAQSTAADSKSIYTLNPFFRG
jgi:hypothetical protein